jgi:hypothetical protein
MTKLILRRGLAALLGAAFSMGALASTPTLGNLSLFAGGKLMDRDDWSPADQQWDLGGVLAYQPADWPFGFTAAYFSSYGKGSFEGSEFKSYTHEIQLGLEKIWAVSSFGRPYVAGGVVLGKAEGSVEDANISDHAVGGWVGGGFTFVLARHLALGIDNRYSYVPVHIGGSTVQGGGYHFGATLGFAW